MPRGILDEYPERYYECRDLGHAWASLTIHKAKRRPLKSHKVMVVPENLRCTRCGTLQYREIYQGDILTRKYAYADGYLQQDGTGRKRRDYRRARIETAIRKLQRKG